MIISPKRLARSLGTALALCVAACSDDEPVSESFGRFDVEHVDDALLVELAWPAFGLIAAPFFAVAIIGLPSVYEAKGAVAKESIHNPKAFSTDALAKARASGKPVFLWFTADWCVTCKVNESTSIERESVRAAFEKAGVVTMVGDWTVRDPAITQFLTEQGAAGVPLYLWYAPGAAMPEQLPQVLTPDLLEAKVSAGR